MHFRYAFSELAAGMSPTDGSWLIHRKITKYSDTLGKLPYSYTEQQKRKGTADLYQRQYFINCSHLHISRLARIPRISSGTYAVLIEFL